MSAWRSRSGGHRLVGWSDLAIAALTAWVAPMVPGLALMALAPILPNEAALFASALGLALAFSPIASWVGLIIGVPLSVLCLAKGRFGWAVAPLVGLVSGAFAAQVVGVGDGIAGPLGAVAAVVFRAVLAGMKPVAFQPV
ncbi:MAG: hypothetical protein Q7J57_12855 [Gemmobacter sp.]|nr:hypothetical protein [Gemmobacter sp.]